MRGVLGIAVVGLSINVLAWIELAWETKRDPGQLMLLNASYDPTRELWRELNRTFRRRHEADTGVRLAIRQSHGGSSSQARAVIDGMPADVVTLATWTDTDALRQQGLIHDKWEERLPNRSLPFCSTIVFVVRRGNEKQIRDWPDLLKKDVRVICPNPKSSGNGKLAFLAAWGAVRHAGGSDADALAFVTQLYRRVPVLDAGARGSTTTFAQNGIGDVQLTWENEAHLEVRESRGSLQVVYPSVTIQAQPFIAWVDAVVDRKGTRTAAESYLRFLYTDEAQGIIARHHYRPINERIAAEYASQLPPLAMFSVTDIAPSWDDAQKVFFADGAVFDRICEVVGK